MKVSYAPQLESLDDTRDKLEERRAISFSKDLYKPNHSIESSHPAFHNHLKNLNEGYNDEHEKFDEKIKIDEKIEEIQVDLKIGENERLLSTIINKRKSLDIIKQKLQKKKK